MRSLFVHVKVPLYMLLLKIMMSRSMKNTMKKHICAHGVSGRGDARARAV